MAAPEKKRLHRVVGCLGVLAAGLLGAVALGATSYEMCEPEVDALFSLKCEGEAFWGGLFGFLIGACAGWVLWALWPWLARDRRRKAAAGAGALLVVVAALGAIFFFGGDPYDEPAEGTEDSCCPAWSPNGRKIAFHRGGELYVMNADGSHQRRLTRSTSWGQPAWSPDGRKIAFERGDFIWVMRSDETGARRLARRRYSFDPAWSPDGQRIAFVQGDFIYVMDADGTNERRLARSGVGGAPAWSPDGRKIAFVKDDFIYVMDADGTDERRLASKGQGWFGGSPAWSPDGRKIAFAFSLEHPAFSWVNPEIVDIHVMNADGSNERHVSRARDPAWSPDGRKIAFHRGGQIYVMNADGTRQQPLTSTQLSGCSERVNGNWGAAWSPDGRQITFQSDRDCRSETYVMNADGSGQRRLTK